MRFKEVKDNISKIAKIKSPRICQKEVRTLDTIINKNPKIWKINRGSYYDFYSIRYKKHELSGKYVGSPNKKVGRISKEKFQQDSKIIENLRKRGNLEKLISYLEIQCDKCKQYFLKDKGFQNEETGLFYCTKCFENIFYNGLGPNSDSWKKGSNAKKGKK